MSKKEAKELFKMADTDHSGYIDYSEWIAATINKKKILSDENLKAAFKMFDVDGDGAISPDELKIILGKGKNIKEEVWKEIIADVDSNNDGQVDFEEFKAMRDKFIFE